MTLTQLSVPVVNGELSLGTWQGVYLFEHRSHPHRRSVITFQLSDVMTTTVGPYLYQMVLSEGSNLITCQYQQMDVLDRGDGRAATIGIRNLLGDGGVQYFYGDGIANHAGPIENGLAIRFIPGSDLFLPLLRR